MSIDRNFAGIKGIPRNSIRVIETSKDTWIEGTADKLLVFKYRCIFPMVDRGVGTHGGVGLCMCE